MARPKLHTIGDHLYWSYANLTMHIVAVEDGIADPTKKHWQIRSRLFCGLRKGSMKVQGFFNDEKFKLQAPRVCWYCGSAENLSVDHIIARERGGTDSGENLIYACRTCNSSKGSKDLMAWMASRGQFPPLFLLRRYLKQAIHYARQHGLIDVPLVDADELKADLPFDFAMVPHDYPKIGQLRLFVVPISSRS